MANSCCFTSRAAERIAGDSVGTVLLPPLGVANCVVPVSACSIEMRSIGTPSSSATICTPHVFVPVPMSLAPMFRFALPSAKSLTMAVAGGLPPPPCHMPPATPTPRLICDGAGVRARASAQPNAFAPFCRQSAEPGARVRRIAVARLADERDVLQPQLDRVHADLRRQGVHHDLEGPGALRVPRRAERPLGPGVDVDALVLAAHVRARVELANDEVDASRAAVRIRAAGPDGLRLERNQRAVLLHAGLEGDGVARPVAHAQAHLLARQEQADRTAGLLREQRRDDGVLAVGRAWRRTRRPCSGRSRGRWPAGGPARAPLRPARRRRPASTPRS